MQGPSSFTSHHHREVWQGLVGEGEHLPHVEPKLSKPRNPPKTCQTQQLVSGILKVRVRVRVRAWPHIAFWTNSMIVGIVHND